MNHIENKNNLAKLKIVIISFHFYPSLSARSFRATELAKEFAQRGHNVIVYTVTKSFDYSDFMRNTRITVKKLGDFYKNNFFIHNIFGKLIRTLTEFPMIKLIPLIKKIIKEENTIDYLITIAYPHVTHWGVSFSYTNKIKCWVADCGDPYMLNPIRKGMFYFKWIEKRWCKKADFISIPTVKSINCYYKEFKNKIKIIPQGFDLKEVKLSQYIKNDIPTFAYAGNFYKKGRNITSFLKFLSSLDLNFKFIVYTKNSWLLTPYIDKLQEKLIIKNYIPRTELLKVLSKMDFLINIKNDNENLIPSKLIDYYLTKRPILEITSKFNESDLFYEFINDDYTHKLEDLDVSQYNIINICNQFIELYYSKLNETN